MYCQHSYTHMCHVHTYSTPPPPPTHTLLCWQLGSFPRQNETTHRAYESKLWPATRSSECLCWVLALERRLCLIKHHVFWTAFYFTAFQRAVQNATSFSTEEPQPSQCVSLTQLTKLEGCSRCQKSPSPLEGDVGGPLGAVSCLARYWGWLSTCPPSSLSPALKCLCKWRVALCRLKWTFYLHLQKFIMLIRNNECMQFSREKFHPENPRESHSWKPACCNQCTSVWSDTCLPQY